jgi:hypothetical protein
MNAGTCWGKNTIGPRGRSVEKAPGSDFNFNFLLQRFEPEVWTELKGDQNIYFIYGAN